MMRNNINDNVDYLYQLQKDETAHQDHRLMWILTAQALIFTGLCSLLPKCKMLNDYVLILLILVGVFISVSGLYSVLISKTAIGTVYERWRKYDSGSLKKKKRPLHHLVSLAPSHFLRSKISWLMFCHFAPNVFCAAWITLLSTYLMYKFNMCKSINDEWYLFVSLFIVLLLIIVSISHFLGKHYLYHWGYDQYHEREDEDISSLCDNCVPCDVSAGLIPTGGIVRGVGYNGNGVIQNSFNNYGCSCQEGFINRCSTCPSKAEKFPVGIQSWEDLRIYHIMIDRFNGEWYPAKDGKGFFGGTLQGIIKKIDYIKEMGYNAILLTPVFKSNAYHGYHTTDYETIDEHFGDWKNFDDLISVLHQNGMKLLCDYVPNHCHISHPFFQAALDNPNSPYRAWFYFDESRKGGFVSYQNFPDLPKFNLYNEVASDYLISIAVMLAKRGVDGIRIDHVIGVPFEFLKKLRAKVKKINPHLFLFGEAWFSSLNDLSQVEFISAEQKSKAYKGELTQEEIQLNYANYLDGVLDFSFRELMVNEAEDAIANKSKIRLLGNKSLIERIQSHFNKYPADFQLILFLDNHDTNRFLFHCKGDKSLLQEGLTLCRNFFPKPYSVYYGTEKGMSNETDIHQKPYGDEQVREPMDW